ncbi:MAG: ATP-dependent helicase HrpB [bacterium]|nr:ATP-dependent helicase HrpB [bacterium]
MIPTCINLPITPVIPEIQKALNIHSYAVLEAPPGAGKTTFVPQALLDEPWLEGRKIIMLEPRRLATRAAAMRMAELVGEKPGQTIGYRTRMDSMVGPGTRIEVVTEGVLTRFLQEDPSLEGIGLLIFDEFHERSIHADLGLALALESQAVLRDDLKILIMSATLDGKSLACLLGNAPVITSRGRSFPVDTRYEPVSGFRGEAMNAYSVISKVITKIRQVIKEEDGDILVFLPGASEIRRVDKELKISGMAEDILIYPLYANLSKSEQDDAISPSAKNKRKIVLATSIAETSLTIEGVRIVIDSGLMRVSRFSPVSGMSRLETAEVSRAAADQRRGRAGRLEDGVCYRLWSKTKILKAHSSPEIIEADLSSLALELALWGEKEPTRLRWLDVPPKSSMAHAGELLKLLEAIDDEGIITAYGKKMARLPLHPRFAHMVLKGKELGLAPLACDIAAILSEKDMLRYERGHSDADLRLRVDLLRNSRHLTPPGMILDLGVLRRIKQLADQLRKKLGTGSINADSNQSGLLLAFAYPDRIAKKERAVLEIITWRVERARTWTSMSHWPEIHTLLSPSLAVK